MKPILFFLATCAGVLSGVLAIGAPVQRPDRFPDVPLEPQSTPTYVALAADPWTNHIAYLLFDGNLKAGYGRCYVWIPGDFKYGHPVAITKQAAPAGTAPGAKATSATFAPLKLSATQGDEESAMTWTVNWLKGGGKRGSYDYVTGKSGTYTVPDYSRFDFSLAYESGPRAYSTQASGTAPLDITMVGALPTTELWTNVVPYMPWNDLHFFMAMKQTHEKKGGRVRFDGRLTLSSADYYMSPVTVRSVPKEWTFLLVVAPYMGQPIYSNTLSAVQCFKEGVEVDMPYGWYDLYWAIAGHGARAVSRMDIYAGVTSPQSFPKPDPLQ